MNKNDLLLEFNNFGFQYNAQSKPTLNNINFALHRGEKVLIAGPSGCGKSTMVHCINGLIPFSYKGEMTGSLKIKGQETRNLSLFEISKSVGTVLQDSDSQFVGLTVAEDIAFALENDCVPQDELTERVKEVATTVNVRDFLGHAPGDLSGGQKQRVSMAGVLVDDVDILLFDEPLANLDPKTGKDAIELIDEMQKKTGAAVIIVEHRLEDVLHRHVDRVVLMSEGSIVADLSTNELLSSNLLADHGIREPLYVTALKYAGVKVTARMCPESIDKLNLSGEDIKKVCDWFKACEKIPGKETPETILKASDIEFEYDNGHKALYDISLEVGQGEMIAIVGTNGAGKSTFSKVVCGFEKENRGQLTFKGSPLSELSIKERADHIGYVMQNPNQMISKVMIMDEVALGLRSRGRSEEVIKERTENALKVCGLWPFRNWPVSALSFGQKKRVTIASILALDPEIIILDEPTAGQDFRHYTEIMEFLTELNSKGITIIMITHDMHLMLEYASRSVVFSKGTVIADDTAAKILTNDDIVKRASLKETSLYRLAVMCGIDNPSEFVQCFIDYERSHREAQKVQEGGECNE
ncbi:MAG: ABC transporter ATP-binding protein [Lachnospiraceae bacterium]|nr:ABC transporter ATP-binding protein [Lachnospiraceae bacterium]